jgi:hypothetical protein
LKVERLVGVVGLVMMNRKRREEPLFKVSAGTGEENAREIEGK